VTTSAIKFLFLEGFNPLTPNDHYSGRTAPLTSKRFILCIYSTNIGTEYFKHDINSSFFSLKNAVCFIILTYLVTVLFTFYVQGVLKFKKNNSGAKRLMFTTAHTLAHSSLRGWISRKKSHE
jgi:predicted membrane protein